MKFVSVWAEGLLEMDRIAFAKMVDDAYSECKTEEEIASRMEWMLDCIKIQAKFSVGYLKTGTNHVPTHEDICRTAAELAYEEHMKQTNNVVKEPKDCPYYDSEKRISEVEKGNERIGICL